MTSIESTPKSHNARVLDLDAETVAQLRAHQARQDDERAVWTGDRDNDLDVAKLSGRFPRGRAGVDGRFAPNAILGRRP